MKTFGFVTHLRTYVLFKNELYNNEKFPLQYFLRSTTVEIIIANVIN
jgi:hypothetical protein